MSDYAFKASIGLLKRVPSGSVRLGSRFHPREQPVRSVHVPEFEIAHAPVTVSQYTVFLESGAANQQRWWSTAGWDWLQGISYGWGREDRSKPDRWDIQRRRQHHPVVGITWFEAEAYCNWVAHQKKQVIQLPTEEQWERAARGDDARPFPWGETFDAALANTLEGDYRDTVEVASIAGDASPFGVLGMCGNVQEWTSSPYSPLADEVFSSQILWIARGGSFNDTVYGARTSYRRAYPPGYYYPFLGFRVVVGAR